MTTVGWWFQKSREIQSASLRASKTARNSGHGFWELESSYEADAAGKTTVDLDGLNRPLPLRPEACSPAKRVKTSEEPEEPTSP